MLFFFLHVTFKNSLSKLEKCEVFKEISQKRPCISLFSLSLACVTCWCWGSSLEEIRGVAVTADIGMKCTQGQNLCLCWHPVFTVTATQSRLSLSVVVRHMTTVLTHRNYHIYSEVHLSQRNALVSMHFELSQSWQNIQSDWFAYVYVWSPITNFQCSSLLTLLKSDFLGGTTKKQFFGKWAGMSNDSINQF